MSLPPILHGPDRPDLLRHEILADVFEATAARLPGKTALMAGERHLTYAELDGAADLVAHRLIEAGVRAGDMVGLWLPRGIELLTLQLGIAKTGAAWLPFDADVPTERIAVCLEDAAAKALLIDERHGEAARGQEGISAQILTAQALLDPLPEGTPLRRREGALPGHTAYVIYTSGSTGKPKGVLHTTGGYLLGANMTFNYVFDHKPDDTFWCTADIGWVTGHSYILYGPLSNGATSLMFEGVPSYPDAGRFWQICDKFGVTVFYTAPTAIRALMREGVKWVEKHRLNTLRLLGSVGEPINPEAWEWYYHNVGKGRCPVVDTWWQTETGSIMISPLPGAIDAKPGSATKPFFGIEPVIVDNDGKELEGATSGNLCIKQPWPSMMRGVYGDPERFFNTYFVQFKGYYFTGDGANRDEDGYYWNTGRVDDVLNVSGHRLGSAEVESALVEHQSVAEAAVVGYPHDIKGQGIYAYVTVKNGVHTNDELKKELLELVAEKIGKIARPDVIHWAPGLPKTRSGKIMRRILRKIAEGEFSNLGDISTLADPSVVATLVEDKQKYHS